MSSLEPQKAFGRSQTRPWLAAPPLLRGEAHVEAIEVLLELPDAVGLRLWQHIRFVTQWILHPELRAGMKRDQETDLTREGVPGLPAVLSGAFAILDALRTAPDAGSEEEVARACQMIATWAKGESWQATSLAFRQAAALLSSTDPRLACEVGREARDCGDTARAESWFRKAIRLARGKDWETYTLAYLVLAGLYMRTGNYPAAKALAMRGLKTSLRRRVKSYTGFAYHDLFVIAAETGRVKEANELAALAFETYGRTHGRIPALAHDVACFWLNQGQFARALTVFSALSSSFVEPADRALIAANTARAAAGLADGKTYERKGREAIRALNRPVSKARAGEVYLALAKGAGLAGNMLDAEKWARHAHRIASENGLAQLRMQAEAELDAARAESRLDRAGAVESLNVKDRAEQLANEFVQTLGTTPVLSLARSC